MMMMMMMTMQKQTMIISYAPKWLCRTGLHPADECVGELLDPAGHACASVFGRIGELQFGALVIYADGGGDDDAAAGHVGAR